MKKILIVLFCCMVTLNNSFLKAGEQKLQSTELGDAKNFSKNGPGGQAYAYLYKDKSVNNLPATTLWKDKNMIFVVNQTENDYNFRVEVASGGSGNDFQSCVAKGKMVSVYTSLSKDSEMYFRFSLYKPGKDCTDIVDKNRIGTVEWDKRDRESLVFLIRPNDEGGNSLLDIYTAEGSACRKCSTEVR